MTILVEKRDYDEHEPCMVEAKAEAGKSGQVGYATVGYATDNAKVLYVSVDVIIAYRCLSLVLSFCK